MPAFSQPIGSRAAGMGGAVSAVYGGPWALFGNPAAADTLRPAASFFAMRYYGFPELTDLAAGLVLPGRAGVFSAGLHRYGDDRYREQRFRLGWKGRAGRLRFGAALSWHHVSLGGGYGSEGAPSLDIGLLAELKEGILLGMRAVNLNGGAWQTAAGPPEELPRLMSVGLAWRLGREMLLAVDVDAESGRRPVIRAGVELEVFPGLTLRAGSASRPAILTGGLSYAGGHWGVGLAVQRHPDPLLGYSPGLDFHLYL